MIRSGTRSISIDKTAGTLIGGKDYRYGLLLVYYRFDGIDDLLSVPVLICDRLPYSVDQADCSQKGFSRVLRATYNQEYCRYEPGYYLNVLIGLHI